MDDRIGSRSANNIGVINLGGSTGSFPAFRCNKLRKLEQQFHCAQFNHKVDWNEAVQSPQYVPLKDRKPLINYPLPKLVTDRVVNKLATDDTFPKFINHEDPDTELFFKELQKSLKFRRIMTQAIEYIVAYGACFSRIKVINGIPSVETYNPNNCFPVFDANGELESVEIRYIFEKKDKLGLIKRYWYRATMDRNSDVLYDNPEAKGAAKPQFKEVNRVDHNMGFVQGEWCKFTDEEKKFEGPSLFKDIADFGEALSYIFSLQVGGVEYGIDPQLIISGMTEGEVDNLIKSKEKAWFVGREGQANFAEIQGTGIDSATAFYDQSQKVIQDITQVIIHDPEKFSSHAQSGKALEILHGPLVELVKKYRGYVGPFLLRLLIKIATSLKILSERGYITDLDMNGVQLQILSLVVRWPPVFEMTVQDKSAVINYYLTLTNGNIISRQTALQLMIKDGLLPEDIDLAQEIQLVNSQQQFNTWGGF